jgi:hypothetical protein
LRHGWRPRPALHIAEIDPFEPSRFPILPGLDAIIDGEQKRMHQELPMVGWRIDEDRRADST